MSKRSFQYLKELIKENETSLADMCVSLGESTHLFSKLKEIESEKDIEEQPKEEPAVPLVPFKNFLGMNLTDSSQDTLSFRAKQLAKSILIGETPRYWESWAHRNTYVSNVVEEYPEVAFVNKFLYRSIMQVSCGLKRLGETLIVEDKDSKSLLLLNTEAERTTIFEYMTSGDRNKTVQRVLSFLMSCSSIDVIKAKPLRINFSTPDLDTGTKTYNKFLDRYLHYILSKTTDPVLKYGGYEYYLIDFPTLILYTLYDKFPHMFSLHNNPEFLIEATKQIPTKISAHASRLISNKTTCLFVWSNNALKRRAFSPYEYRCTHQPRLDKNITSEVALETIRNGKAFNKIDNKVFFNFASFFEVAEEEKEEELYIAKKLHVSLGDGNA